MVLKTLIVNTARNVRREANFPQIPSENLPQKTQKQLHFTTLEGKRKRYLERQVLYRTG